MDLDVGFDQNSQLLPFFLGVSCKTRVNVNPTKSTIHSVVFLLISRVPDLKIFPAKAHKSETSPFFEFWTPVKITLPRGNVTRTRGQAWEGKKKEINSHFSVKDKINDKLEG